MFTELPHSPEWKRGSGPAKEDRVFSELEGKNLQLDCHAIGNPQPKFTWLKDGQKLTKGSNKIEVKEYSFS